MDRTPWNPEWSAAIERVSALVESLFSCRVKFQTIDTFLQRDETDVAPLYLEQDLVFLESTLFEPPLFIRGTRVGHFAFPLRVRRAGAPATDVSLVGIAAIEGLAASDDDRLLQLGEFLQMATESRLDAFERLLDVEHEERLFLAQADTRENPNVIRLFPRNLATPADVSENSFQLRNYGEDLALSKPLLLVATEPSTPNDVSLNRIAIEIFNRTSLWFFVSIQDLSDDAFQSAQSFRDMGRMCIFVPDLAKMTIEKQLRIAEVFGSKSNSTDHADSPRLITALHDSPQRLIEQGLVLPHLMALFTVVEIDLSLPARQAVRKIESLVHGTTDARPETKASNLIPLMGRWQIDDGSNPTFH